MHDKTFVEFFKSAFRFEFVCDSCATFEFLLLFFKVSSWKLFFSFRHHCVSARATICFNKTTLQGTCMTQTHNHNLRLSSLMTSKSAKANKNSFPVLHSTVPRARRAAAAVAQSGHFHFRRLLPAADSSTIYITQRKWRELYGRKSAHIIKFLIYFTVNETFMVALSPSKRYSGWREWTPRKEVKDLCDGRGSSILRCVWFISRLIARDMSSSFLMPKDPDNRLWDGKVKHIYSMETSSEKMNLLCRNMYVVIPQMSQSHGPLSLLGSSSRNDKSFDCLLWIAMFHKRITLTGRWKRRFCFFLLFYFVTILLLSFGHL